MRRQVVFSIGHSNQSTRALLELLRRHKINAVADIRSSPFSRFNPQFNREDLQAALERTGIAYVFLGRELGARSEDLTCYDANGRVQYRKLASSELFKQGLDRVLQGSRTHRLALLCAEKEPLDCHRTILVARELVAQGLEVQHILADGQLESHDTTMDRLLRLHGLPQRDLFRDRDELLAEAYERQERRIAYTRRETPAETD